MSRKMLLVLQTLHQAEQNDYPWLSLDGVHSRTINSLLRRDWIVESKGFDGVKFKITGRGVNALQVYAAPSRRRSDGICPDCGKRPKGFYKSGKRMGYCVECNRIRKKQQFLEHKAGGWIVDPNKPCSDCDKRPRHQFPSGFTSSYCHECLKKRHRKEKRRQHKRRLKFIKKGGELLCIRCRKRPRYHTDKVVYDYCHACYRELQNDYFRRKQFVSVLVKYGLT